MYKQNRLLLLALLLSLTGCASEGGFKLPGVYRVDVQQGNVIEQDTVNRLRLGMDRNQVQFIMGSPAIADPFHADQWDYIFTLSEGGGVRKQRHVRMHFEDGLLASVEGDVVPSTGPDAEITRQSRTVEVPIRHDSDRGFFRRLLNILPFV
ncbi:MAG: outer membrane protein assembly factor BamE, partial [Gammaproteobacteria bacterium]